MDLEAFIAQEEAEAREAAGLVTGDTMELKTIDIENAKLVLSSAIAPAFNLLPTQMFHPNAARLMLAISYQEARLVHRRQLPQGPARGLWQFEQGGGVAGVMAHRATREHAQALAEARRVPFVARDIHGALEYDDVLAAGFARLLLWTDPRELPVRPAPSWRYYLDNWRPGKPHGTTWPYAWALAARVVPGAPTVPYEDEDEGDESDVDAYQRGFKAGVAHCTQLLTKELGKLV